jgi:hypothetical protein
VPSGVPQGSHLGPLLFNIFINSVCSVISPARILLFADDAKIFHAVSSLEDSKILQNILDKFSSWCEIVGLSLNIGKCRIMSFYRTRQFINFDYSLNGLQLYRVDQIIDLGFLFVPSLDFHPHIDYIVSKSVRVLGFIRRHSTSFNSPKCLSALYCALIRSVLEYGDISWVPYTICDSLRVDKVQNRFLNYAGYCLNIFHLPHDYQLTNDVLRLDSLASRRQTHCYRFITGLANGQIDAPRLLERLSIQVLSSTRSQETFYIPTSRSNFSANAPLLRMMRIYNLNTLWHFVPRLLIYLYFLLFKLNHSYILLYFISYNLCLIVMLRILCSIL